MKATSLYPWLEPYSNRLLDYIRQKKIPQALLLTGNSGLGKRKLAEYYATILLCENSADVLQACGKCQSCKLVASATHPDFLIIEPEESGKAIGINVIRELIIRMSLKPQFNGQRIIIIDAADHLNNAAANAFLKCLEEPNERTSFVLIAEKPSVLPITIRSRCQNLFIELGDKSLVYGWLAQNQVTDPELMLELAQDLPLKALAYAENDMLSVYQQCLSHWVGLINGKGKLNAVQLAENWQKTLSAEVILGWLSKWLVILIKQQYQQPAGRIEQSALQEIRNRLDLSKLFQCYDLLLQSRCLVDTQANKQLLLERVLIEATHLSK